MPATARGPGRTSSSESFDNFDLPPIMGVTLYGASFIVVFSVAIDVVHAYLDPRVRVHA